MLCPSIGDILTTPLHNCVQCIFLLGVLVQYASKKKTLRSYVTDFRNFISIFRSPRYISVNRKASFEFERLHQDKRNSGETASEFQSRKFRIFVACTYELLVCEWYTIQSWTTYFSKYTLFSLAHTLWCRLRWIVREFVDPLCGHLPGAEARWENSGLTILQTRHVLLISYVHKHSRT